MRKLLAHSVAFLSGLVVGTYQTTMNQTNDPSASAMPLAFEGRRRLTTIMFSDICSYTEMMGKSESTTMRIVQRNLEIHQRLLKKYHGTLIKELGDGLLSSFDSPSAAVHCAKALMATVHNKEDFDLHIGIHQGEVVFTKNDVFGEGVNISARIDSEALPGEILVSGEVWKNIRNKEEFTAVSIGKKHLKNVRDAIKLYRIMLDEEDPSSQYLHFLKRRKGQMVKYGMLILLPVLLIVALFFWYERWYQAPLSEYKSIAVLPFEDKNANTEMAYLGQGIAEEVISQFFGLPTIAVISSRSSFQFQNTDKTVQQLSRALKTDLILEGSYVIEQGELQVKVELVSASSNEILSYASYTSEVGQVKILAANISREIFRTLRLSNWQQSREAEDNSKVNVEAYKYYTMGKNAMRDNTLQTIDQVIQYFTHAIELDSTYADAYIGMAEAYLFDVSRGYMSPTEASQKARKYIMSAERLAPGSGEVHGVLGVLYCWEYNFHQAISHFERSIQISPNYDMSYQWYAYALAMQGQIDKGISLFDKAIILDPLNMLHYVIKSMHLTAQGNFVEAQQLLDGYLELNPGHQLTLWALGVLHLEGKDYQAAYDVFLERNIGMESNFCVGYAYAMLGMDTEALVVLNRVLENSKTRYVPPAQLAILYVGLGQYDKALAQVEQAYLVHDTWIFWIKYSNMLDPIREDPRFVAVIDMIDD